MAAKKFKRSPKDWLQLIREGEKYREKFGRSKEWERFWNYYRGDFGDDKNYMRVNIIFSIARTLVPRIYFRNPQVIVTPMIPGRYLHAKVLERLDNRIQRECRIKQALKAASLDAFLYGTGIVKRGYDSQFGFDPEASTEVQGALESGSGEVGSERIEYDWTVRPGWPWVRRIHPASFVVPWGTVDLESAPWCAHEIVRPLEDVQKDPKYSRAVTRELKPNLSRQPTPYEQSFQYTETSKNEYVRLWEIYDAKTSHIFVIAENEPERFLRADEDDLSRKGFPFHAVVFNPDHDHFWGISDVINLEPIQLELNDIRTQAKLHRRVARLKILYKDGSFDDAELLKLLEDDRIGIGVKVNGSVADCILPFQPHVPTDFAMLARESYGDAREMVGMSRNQMGEFDISSRRTATEASLVEQASGIRVDERRDVLADTQVDIIAAINENLFDYWSEPRVAQIVGPDGARWWVEFTGEDLRGEYSYRIDPDVGLPVSARIRREEAKELLQAAINLQLPNPMELVRHLLQQYEGIDVEAVLTPPQQSAMRLGGPVPLNQLAAELAKQQIVQALGGVPNAAV